ncbi:DNA replication/repair protein RecF [Nocardiopsis tropica]|jgi:DNA replication and repair protein RecF|uniref:DNA replication and repair protein RecF n=1 Tax=Nocardiopsis tropica TaxID=109330 RepID=A0ABU7L140_9ACTN|nr:DNA replication/repair protein RecF [Nocardiopsis umidischolae]MEE2055250.1 DNA replication/repair protein RecF [Nocardiopsis umidischolae]
MYVSHLQLADFRSYESALLELAPGVSVFVGSNGQGKTNLVEAIGYVATLGSHRVSSDTPLVRVGAPRAIVRAKVVRDDRSMVVDLELNPGRANRARINQAAAGRPRDVLGILRTVLFAPEDLALVKGDPGERRRFLDDLLVARTPRMAGVRSDYDRVLKQRNALLKSASSRMFKQRAAPDLSTLEVWDDHLAEAGAELLAARLALVEELRPRIGAAYAGLTDSGGPAVPHYRSSAAPEGAGLPEDRPGLADALRAAMAEARDKELQRGISLVGPHRDDLHLQLGDMPAKGYASQGESWSYALSLKLAAFELLRADGDDPVLILDDVFAELDSERRRRLAERVRDAEQVLVTAAVAEDIPDELDGARFGVREGAVEGE